MAFGGVVSHTGQVTAHYTTPSSFPVLLPGCHRVTILSTEGGFMVFSFFN